ncbi:MULTISPECIES: hypothetical protein [unclassified Streptomyces]|uniref:hypothetical protein n=1 Tax=unclassified Streptomyces TaxID=2593676 RepID=UPI00166015BB|nr:MULTISPECIES: hypothetical protein [unclassified Streptomyces]MBD0709620.1 hypothetical protein [Streptomyces sp. CBMA291]MBD0714354.1 hypothetical protein [Streptomyces sp. CBMA370]
MSFGTCLARAARPVVAAALTLPPLRRLRPAEAASSAASTPASRWWKRPLPGAVLLTVGTGVFSRALLLKNLPLLIVLTVTGLAVAVPALRWVAPEGTLSARPGPASARASSCAAFCAASAAAARRSFRWGCRRGAA